MDQEDKNYLYIAEKAYHHHIRCLLHAVPAAIDLAEKSMPPQSQIKCHAEKMQAVLTKLRDNLTQTLVKCQI